MPLPDYTTQDPATYKANIDAEIAQNQSDISDIKDPATLTSKVHADLQSAQSVAGSGISTVLFDTEDFDTLGEYDTSTGAFTPTEEGYYRVSAIVTWANAAWTIGQTCYIWTAKGGGNYDSASYPIHRTATFQFTMAIESLVYCNGTTDSIAVRVQNGHTSARSLYASGARTAISINRVL